MTEPGRVQLYIAVSVDGFIAPPDGSVRWLDDYFDVDYGFHDFLAGVGTVVMGRKTYDQVRTFEGPWPYPGKACVVLTSGEPDDGAEQFGVEFTGEDFDSIIERHRSAGHIWLIGGGGANRAFAAQALIDDFLIATMPVLLGDGVRLFSGPFPGHKLKLDSTKPYPNGVVMSTYSRAN